MVVELVPLTGGIGGIVHPPSGRKDTTYIPLVVLAFWGVICYWSHLLGEPETTIDKIEEPENLYKLYGYGLCKGNPSSNIAQGSGNRRF